MEEYEDDSKLKVQAFDGTSGIPTWTRLLWDFDKGLAVLAGKPNAGKAQPLDSKILTPTGWKTMGSLRLGDVVCTPDGKTSKITHIFPQGIKDVYQVVLSDGTETRACGDHLWSVSSRVERLSKPGQYFTRTTREILSKVRVKDGLGKYSSRLNYVLPYVSATHFVEKDVPIDPYLLGCLLGDGGLTSAPVLTSMDKDLVKSTALSVGASGLILTPLGKMGYGITKGKPGPTPNLLKEALKRIGVWGKKSQEKFVPKEYLWNSLEIRLKMLQGLMDTDGTIDKAGRVTFDSTSKQLVEDVAFLVRSLGGVARVGGPKKRGYEKNGIYKRCSDSFWVSMSLPDSIPPFLIERKEKRVVSKEADRKKTRWLHRSIQSVTYVGEEECQCIRIDHPSHLYITDDFIPTHNSSLLITMMTNLLRLNDNVVVLDISLDDPSSKRNVQLRANLSGLNYQQIGIPSELTGSQREALGKADLVIEDWITNGRLIQFESSEDIDGKYSVTINDATKVFDLLETTRKLYPNPETKIVMFLDAWNDVNFRGGWKEGNDLSSSEAFLNQLKSKTQELEILGWLSAHTRKLESNKSTLITLQDVKGTSTLESNCVWGGIIRNDYREDLVEDPPTIDINGIQYPIIRAETRKTKVSSWDLPWYGILKANSCQVLPVHPDQYTTFLYKQRDRKKKF